MRSERGFASDHISRQSLRWYNSLPGGIYGSLSLNQLIRLNLTHLETSALAQSRSEGASARPLKETVQPTMKLLSSFTYPHVGQIQGYYHK